MIMMLNEFCVPVKPPLAMIEAASTEVPINAPPIISKTVVNFDFSPNPIAKERINMTIEDVPNIIPLCAAVIGKKPPVLPCATAASAIYVSNNTIAIIANASDARFFRDFVWTYIIYNKTMA